MTEAFDVVVVGAGPSGSAAAFTLAEEGLSVLLLEEHGRIGIPVVCAEGISRSTIKDHLEIKPEWISRPLKGSIIRGPDNREFKIEYPGCGWILNREIFDEALAKKAAEKGAMVKTSTKAIGIDNNQILVNEKNTEKKYRFRYIIAADGIASKVGAWLGLDTRLSMYEIEVCAEYLLENIKVDPDYTALIVGENYAPGGYAWIFPKSANSANVGLGISPHNTRQRAKDILDQWIKQEFPNAKIARRVFGGVPAKILKRYCGDNFFLVGDAARLADPLTGAGIANGIKSGILAAQSIISSIHGNKISYEKELKNTILKEISSHFRIRDKYLNLTDREFLEIFRTARDFFEGKTVTNINIVEIVRHILFASPLIFRVYTRIKLRQIFKDKKRRLN